MARLVLIFCLCECSSATSIVVLVTRHGITIGADGKIVKPATRRSPRTTTSGLTLFLVHNRIAIAGCGVESVGEGDIVPWDFPKFVDQLRADVSPNIKVSQFIETARQSFSNKFDGFDILLRNGALKEGSLQELQGGGFFRFYVAGYEDGKPLVSTIELDIDWQNLEHSIPAARSVYPDVGRKNLSLIWTGGNEHGIIELGIQHLAAAEQLRSKMPAEIAALVRDQDLNLIQTLRFDRALLDFEVERNRNMVGYPLTIITIPGRGSPRSYTYRAKNQHRESNKSTVERP